MAHELGLYDKRKDFSDEVKFRDTSRVPAAVIQGEPINIEGEFTPPVQVGAPVSAISQLVEGAAKERNEADDNQERAETGRPQRKPSGGISGELAILLGGLAGAAVSGGGVQEVSPVVDKKLASHYARQAKAGAGQSKLDMYMRTRADKLADSAAKGKATLTAAELKADTKEARDLVVDTDKLRKEVGGSKDIKDHQVIESNYQNIDNIIQKGKYGDFTKADDISLIFSFMKMLDPSSVVRESEQATVANSGTIPESIRSLYNKLLVTGEILPPQVRWDYVKQSNALVNTKRTDIGRKLEEYKSLASRRGMKSEDLILGRFGIEGDASIPEYVEQNGWIYDKKTGKAIQKAGK